MDIQYNNMSEKNSDIDQFFSRSPLSENGDENSTAEKGIWVIFHARELAFWI
jgi:hypothetical protein